MKNLKRSILSVLLIIALVLSTVVPVFAVGSDQPAKYSKTRNSGTRHVVCTTLDNTSAGSYYGTGYRYEDLSVLSASSLLTKLRTLLTKTHDKTTSYDDCKNYADETDCEKEKTNIITIYTSYSSSQSEYSGGSGWNREHVWPKALGGFKTSGAGADLHHIRPSENKTNGDRGSLKYGEVSGGKTSKGNLSGLVGGYYSSYYEPLDNVKGDVARICLYVYVRYGGELSKCSSITNVFQSVDVLLAWCELDPVDTWEMGRNEVVYAIQGNRNVFIDYPEYAWLLFGKEIPDGMMTPSGSAMGDSCNHGSTEIRNVTEATCTESGYTGDVYCKDCGKKISAGSTVSASGHIWSEFTTDGDSKTHTCLECGITESECMHPETEIRNQRTPTCTTNGNSGDTYCVVCDTKIASGRELFAGGHIWGEWVEDNGQSIRTCERCGVSESDSGDITCAHANTEIRNAKDATCCATGYTGDTYCTDCGERLFRGKNTPISDRHEWGEATKMESSDIYVSVCTVCGLSALFNDYFGTVWEGICDTDEQSVLAALSKSAFDDLINDLLVRSDS